MKRFNTAGTCFPNRHYMVDIQERLDIIKEMVSRGDYFCINRGRQYGKTTTLSLLKRSLEADGYSVFSLSFEGLDESTFKSVESILHHMLLSMKDLVEFNRVKNIDEKGQDLLASVQEDNNGFIVRSFIKIAGALCYTNKIVILIDEVDQACNNETFIAFLGALRTLYLDRDESETFQSVILAGVYDVKNLKLKMRPEGEHQSNSPWNIAVPFDVDMSLSKDGIAGMLEEYKADTNANVDTQEIAQLIRDYTSGYPFLVSRLCQLMDQQKDWSREGFLKAEKNLVMEKNTLFDDMNKKVEQFPSMRNMIWQMLFRGQSFAFNINSKEIEIASMFAIVSNKDGQVAISNRIFETVLYEKFVAEDVLKGCKVYSEAQISKPEFIKDRQLDVPLILSRFISTFKEIYGEQTQEFLENEGRRLFILYVKPIINGVGNYYVEAQTRDGLRADLIIDYLGHSYIIEMKIWRGNSYNERGEEQLAEYLNRFDEPVGYMLSFCFNKNKTIGVKEPITIKGKTLIEAVV